jgi:NAD(P)-dependent dehydrogenase (short-subunit alcohol dehydrogenase family)
MDLRLRGAAVLVTGGSRGLGREFALGFAEEGADIGICARSVDELEKTASEIRSRGVRCVAVTANLFESEDCRRAVDETARAFGRLDVLVNNASTSVDKTPASIENATDSQIMERFLGKTMAAIRCSRAAIPHMRKIGGGRIVCIGGTAARSVSRSGDNLSPGSGLPQGLGNSALANFSKYLAEELAGDRILVNVVHPHLVVTGRHASRVAAYARNHGLEEKDVEALFAKQIPIGRMIMPSDVTPFVLLFASPLAGATTGQAFAVDGGALRAVNY